MRILVVEDDVALGDVIRRALAETGYAVTIAGTAPGGIEAFEIDTYDLVVLDLMLPGLPDGGMGVCRRIREINHDTPVLMLTALDSMRPRSRGWTRAPMITSSNRSTWSSCWPVPGRCCAARRAHSRRCSPPRASP